MANLTLNTVNSVTTVSFTTTLPGHPDAPLYPPPLPAGPPQHPRPQPWSQRHRGPAKAALAGALSLSSTSPSTVAPVAPSTPETLRNSEKSDLDTLNISNLSETRMGEEEPSTPDHMDHIDMPATRYMVKLNDDDIDNSITEATRILRKWVGQVSLFLLHL